MTSIVQMFAEAGRLGGFCEWLKAGLRQTDLGIPGFVQK